ncbi:MAG: tetratricopeptide repeat protein [Planctomycetia bacterium]|nr:tetratricopeptide repeat protein [Planctomycetia bacterium]
MHMSLRCGLWALVLLAGAGLLRAQPDGDEPPALLEPEQVEAPEQANRREARRLYGQALTAQRQDRLVEALRNFERARELDPESVAPYRALIPLYLAIGRAEDALAACERVVKLEPGDHETWYIYARHLRDLGRPKDARAALEKGLACPSAHEAYDLLVQMNFDLGALSEDAQDWARAETAFQAVVKILVDKREHLLDMGPYGPEQLDQETAKSCERLGQVCMRAGKHDRAVAAFMQAQKRDPERAGRLSYHLAQVYVAKSQPAEALKHLDDYLKTQPQGDEAHKLRIEVLKKLGRDRDVLPGLEMAAARDPYNIPLHLLLARHYTVEKQWEAAEKRYATLVESNPGPDVYRAIFTMHKERGTQLKVLDLLDQTLKAARDPKDEGDENPGAVVDFTKSAAAAARARSMLPVLRDDPELVKALLALVQTELTDQRPRFRDTLRYLAILAYRTKQTPAAERLFRACLPTITPRTEAEVYSGLLDALIDQRKHAEVVKLCQEGLNKAQATNRVLFYVKMAPALLRLGKMDEALTAMEEAVKVADEGNRLGVQRLKIEVLRQAEKYDQALAECEALLQEYHRPQQVRDIRYSLSNVCTSAHQHDRAEEQLRLILDADPHDATANNDLGYIMADRGKNLEEAEKLIRRAIELDVAEKQRGKAVNADGAEANAAYIDSLGWVLFRLGQLDEARAQLEKAAKLAGGEEDPVVWDHLGDVYFKLKQPARARTAWEKSVQLYEQERRRKPDERYEEIKGKLKLLDKELKQR